MFQSTSATSIAPRATTCSNARRPFAASTTSKPSSPMIRPRMIRIALESSTISARTPGSWRSRERCRSSGGLDGRIEADRPIDVEDQHEPIAQLVDSADQALGRLVDALGGRLEAVGGGLDDIADLVDQEADRPVARTDDDVRRRVPLRPGRESQPVA